MNSSVQPLAGIRVLELGALVAAPYCGMLLADLGADVIKIEPPEGDMAREFAPFVNGESAFFMSVNRGKRSVRLDLKDPEAFQWVRALAAKSDILIHNYRVGVAERLGLGFDELFSLNPKLVYCAVSGFGPTGPMAGRPAIDLLFQAESGMMAITGTADGPPVKAGTNAADVYAATTAAMCITAALLQRATTGLGCRVDVALRDAFLALQACWFGSYLATGELPGRLGAASPFTAPTDVFGTADGTVVLAVVNAKHWVIFCDVVGLPELVTDPRFIDNESRVARAADLRILVSEALSHRSTKEWLEAFERAKIPGGRVMDYDDVVADEQIRHNQMIIEMDHARAGSVRLPGIPFWFDGDKAQPTVPPPMLGEHTCQVLAELGCPVDDAERFAAAARTRRATRRCSPQVGSSRTGCGRSRAATA